MNTMFKIMIGKTNRIAAPTLMNAGKLITNLNTYCTYILCRSLVLQYNHILFIV